MFSGFVNCIRLRLWFVSTKVVVHVLACSSIRVWEGGRGVEEKEGGRGQTWLRLIRSVFERPV